MQIIERKTAQKLAESRGLSAVFYTYDSGYACAVMCEISSENAVIKRFSTRRWEWTKTITGAKRWIPELTDEVVAYLKGLEND